MSQNDRVDLGPVVDLAQPRQHPRSAVEKQPPRLFEQLARVGAGRIRPGRRAPDNGELHAAILACDRARTQAAAGLSYGATPNRRDRRPHGTHSRVPLALTQPAPSARDHRRAPRRSSRSRPRLRRSQGHRPARPSRRTARTAQPARRRHRVDEHPRGAGSRGAPHRTQRPEEPADVEG